MRKKLFLSSIILLSCLFSISVFQFATAEEFGYNLLDTAYCAITGCDIKGDLNVTGNLTANQIYGSAWGHDIGLTTINAQSVYENITNMSVGNLNGFAWDYERNNTLIVQVPGTYLVTSQFSFRGAANTEYHLALGINGERSEMCHAERKLGTGNDVGSASYTCIEKLNVGNEITGMIENVDSSVDADIHDIQINLVRVGD